MTDTIPANALYGKLGEMVIAWNNIEAIAQYIAYLLAGGGFKTYILIANLGNVAIKEATTRSQTNSQEKISNRTSYILQNTST